MKNEDKIIELLAEQVKKQDQLIVRQDRHEKLLKAVVNSVNHLADIFEKKFEQVNEHEKRIRRLEDRMLDK